MGLQGGMFMVSQISCQMGCALEAVSNGIRVYRMGGEQSKKRDEIVDMIEQYPLRQKNVLSQQQFVNQIFSSLDLAPKHATSGPIIVSGTHVLHRLYILMIPNRDSSTLSKSKAIDVIKKLYDDPEKAIEYSYRIIQPDLESCIGKKQFLQFVSRCYIRGIEAILKYSKSEEAFKRRFAEWASSNRVKILEAAEKVFDDNSLGEREAWRIGDFKRWILSNNHWSIFVDIKGTVYRIPLNIPCLFNVVVQQQKK